MAYISVTRAQFRALLQEQIGAAATVFWTTTELNFIIQETLRFWNLCTGFWKARVTLTTVANQTWYQLPGTITSNLRISWQSAPLSPASIYTMDFGRFGWEGETTGTGGDVPAQPKLFVVGALNLIGIWPQDAAGNTAMTVDGIATTVVLANDSDFIDVGQEELKTLLDLAQHIAVFKEGGKEFEATMPEFKQFLKSAAERTSMLKESAVWRKYMGLDKGKWQKREMSKESTNVGGR